jgi:hypothetical protein
MATNSIWHNIFNEDGEETARLPAGIALPKTAELG